MGVNGSNVKEISQGKGYWYINFLAYLTAVSQPTEQQVKELSILILKNETNMV
jgi:hypothetical protein